MSVLTSPSAILARPCWLSERAPLLDVPAALRCSPAGCSSCASLASDGEPSCACYTGACAIHIIITYDGGLSAVISDDDLRHHPLRERSDKPHSALSVVDWKATGQLRFEKLRAP